MNRKQLLTRSPVAEATPSAWRKRLLYGIHGLAHRLGAPGVIAAGIMVFCVTIWASAIQEQKEKTAAVERELQGGLLADSDLRGIEERRAELAAYQATLPEKSRLARLIGQLHGHAEKAGVRLTNTDFRLADGEPGANPSLPAFIVTLDTVSGHEQTLKFVNLVLGEMPNAALEAISFKRGKLADTALETQVRLRLYVRAP